MPRLTLYSPELAETICDRLEAGEPLAAICRDETIPGVRTVLRWAAEREDFAAMYEAAQHAQAEHLDAEIDEVAKTAVDRESASAARVRIAALQWRASKQSPRRFGERINMEVSHEFDLAAVLDKGRQRVLDGNAKLGLPGPDEIAR